MKTLLLLSEDRQKKWTDFWSLLFHEKQLKFFDGKSISSIELYVSETSKFIGLPEFFLN